MGWRHTQYCVHIMSDSGLCLNVTVHLLTDNVSAICPTSLCFACSQPSWHLLLPAQRQPGLTYCCGLSSQHVSGLRAPCLKPILPLSADTRDVFGVLSICLLCQSTQTNVQTVCTPSCWPRPNSASLDAKAAGTNILCAAQNPCNAGSTERCLLLSFALHDVACADCLLPWKPQLLLVTQPPQLCMSSLTLVQPAILLLLLTQLSCFCFACAGRAHPPAPPFHLL